MIVAGNWKEFDSFCWHDQPDDAEDFAIVYTVNRDSGLLAQSNAEQIAEALAPFPDDAIPQRHRHWACGWIDGYAIRVGSEAWKVYTDLVARLEDYPVLDETDYSKREYDATLENIEREGHYANREDNFVLPANWASATWQWFWDNNQRAVENQDDNGGYPSEAQLQEAWRALGYGRVFFVSCCTDRTEYTEFDSEDEATDYVKTLENKGYFPTWGEVE
jgi:hypothetical protein